MLPSDSEDEHPSGIQKYLTEAVQHVFQADMNRDIKWKSTEFVGKIGHDEHDRLRRFHSVVSKATEKIEEVRKQPVAALPAPPPEERFNLQKYLTGAIESVFNSKTQEVHEPKWFVMPFEGQIPSSRDLERLRRMEAKVRHIIHTNSDDEADR